MLMLSSRWLLAALFVLPACGGGSADNSATVDTGASASSAVATDADVDAPTGPITLTAADIDGFEKGIAR